MKVLHLVNTLSAGGAELHLLTLCRHLKRQGIEVVVACLREHVKGSRSLRPDFEQDGIKVVNLAADRRFDPRCIARLMRLLGQERPDLLHTHLPRADFAGAIGHLFNHSIPLVCSVHGIYSTHWSGKWALPLFDSVWSRADAVIAISYTVRDWLVKERRIPSDKVRVVQYGLEPELLACPSADLRKMWGLKESAVIGSLGRLEPGKRYEYLIRAMPGILKKVPNATLLIAGHDPWGYGKALRAMIKKVGSNGGIKLVGFQSDVPSFLHALDVFAFASRSEGFGQVVIEAMAAGKSVVASKIPPFTEIVVDGETGLLVEPENPKTLAEAISRLLMHPEEAQEMGRRGKERVYSRFTAERMSAATLSLYNELVEI